MKKLLIAIASLLLLSGCATIVRGTNEPVHFNSDPSGANVEMSNGFGCFSTPCSITVPRKINAQVLFKKEGCEIKTATIQGVSSNDGTLFLIGNIIFGGLIGIVVDVVTGAHNDVLPNPVNVSLDCK